MREVAYLSLIFTLFRIQRHATTENLVDRYHVASAAPIVERWELECPQSLFVREWFQARDKSGGPTLDSFQTLLVGLPKGTPCKIAVFEVRPHQGFVDQWQRESVDMCKRAFHNRQHLGGLCCCSCRLLVEFQLLVHDDAQVFLPVNFLQQYTV